MVHLTSRFSLHTHTLANWRGTGSVSVRSTIARPWPMKIQGMKKCQNLSTHGTSPPSSH